jgi:hypothetical protein
VRLTACKIDIKSESQMAVMKAAQDDDIFEEEKPEVPAAVEATEVQEAPAEHVEAEASEHVEQSEQ